MSIEQGAEHQRGSLENAAFAHGTGDVLVNSGFGKPKFVRDLCVAHAACDQAYAIDFAGTESREVRRRRVDAESYANQFSCGLEAKTCDNVCCASNLRGHGNRLRGREGAGPTVFPRRMDGHGDAIVEAETGALLQNHALTPALNDVVADGMPGVGRVAADAGGMHRIIEVIPFGQNSL